MTHVRLVALINRYASAFDIHLVTKWVDPVAPKASVQVRPPAAVT
jgi:hypothetical protein